MLWPMGRHSTSHVRRWDESGMGQGGSAQPDQAHVRGRMGKYLISCVPASEDILEALMFIMYQEDARRRSQQMENEWINDFGCIQYWPILAYRTSMWAGPPWPTSRPILTHVKQAHGSARSLHVNATSRLSLSRPMYIAGQAEPSRGSIVGQHRMGRLARIGLTCISSPTHGAVSFFGRLLQRSASHECSSPVHPGRGALQTWFVIRNIQDLIQQAV